MFIVIIIIIIIQYSLKKEARTPAASLRSRRLEMAWHDVSVLMLPPAPPPPLLLPAPARLPSIHDLMSRSLHELIFYAGKMRPVEEIMMACCAAMGRHGASLLPAPHKPSSLSLLDGWARMESGILSPALHVVSDVPHKAGLAVLTRRVVREGHALLRMPSRLVLDAEGALRALPGLLSPHDEPHVAIAVWLMRMIDSPPPKLSTYLRSLSSDAEVDCSLRWDEEELALLQSSLARSRAAKLKLWAKAMWRSIFVERSEALERIHPPLNASYERWSWALCAVWSRSFLLRCAEPSCGNATGPLLL